MQNKNTKIKTLAVLVLLFCFILSGVKLFNRVPDRVIPEGQNIVSPANGKVIKIEKVDSEKIEFFKNGILQTVNANMGLDVYNVIVIEMNLKNVHTQRAPIEGEVVYQEHFEGAFKNALFSEDKERLANVNEKTLTVFESNDGVKVGVVQVAGAMARRINSFKEKGDFVKKGEPYGNIELGSQVVVILPQSIEPKVELGQTLVDGESIIAE